MTDLEINLIAYCKTNNIPMPIPSKYRIQVDDFLAYEIRRRKLANRHNWRDSKLGVKVDLRSLVGKTFESRPKKDTWENA